jgi:hypothetical protein
MKRSHIMLTGLAAGLCLLPFGLRAGNGDRAGQAGSSELLINPWARGAGWAGVNIAGSRGVEALFLNVAGLPFTKKTEVYFTHTQWLKGSETNINAGGVALKVGEASAIGIGIVAMDFGDIIETTVDQPEGGLGYYTPQFFNVTASYAKSFSNSIYGGVSFKVISQSIADVKASGFAFDAGIQYVTGWNETSDDLKFGITLKNVGSPMKFTGDGLSFRGNPPVESNYQMTLEQRSERFELPSLVAIGASYDWQLAEQHLLTVAGAFTSNSFTEDQFGLGLEYTFKKLFSVRTGYAYEKDITSAEETLTASKGLAGGLSVDIPLGKSDKRLGIDYAYRTTEFFDGTHSFGLRLRL